MGIEITNTSALISIATAITTIGGAWLTVRKIVKDNERRKRQHTAEILQLAKENDQAVKLKLENQIRDLDLKMRTLKEGVDKDISHVKDSFNNEIKFLGQKIEELRSEVRNQHGQLVSLLSKMIDKD